MTYLTRFQLTMQAATVMLNETSDASSKAVDFLRKKGIAPAEFSGYVGDARELIAFVRLAANTETKR